MLSDNIAAFQEHRTPFYFYNLDILNDTLGRIAAANTYGFHVHFAIKANANDRILGIIKEAGLGADCVSGNEVKKAIEIGFPNDRIAFAGVGKTDPEIEYALSQDIFSFNCESVQELEVINQLAANMGKTANIALRLNPDVNPNTHAYITTGQQENKFGINPWELDQCMELLSKLDHLKLVGLHFHIGSQIQDMDVFKSLCVKVNEFQDWFLDRGVEVQHLNVGGGLGVDYENPYGNPAPDFASYFKVFNDFLKLRPNQHLHFELGRAVVAHSGDLISRVLFVKDSGNTNFIILDAGMTELIRPALYQSFHKIENISRPYTNNQQPTTKYDIVGPICESSDCFGKAVSLPPTQRGDLIAIHTAGAYGEVMASSYNLREKAGVVFSDEV